MNNEVPPRSERLSSRIDALSPEKRALLEKLLKRDGIVTDRPPATTERIMPADHSGELPLSFAQGRMWFLEQAGVSFKIRPALRLKGMLDREALEYSLNEIVHRHAVLRTSYRAGMAEPVQVIAAQARVSLEVIDLSDRSRPEQESELRRLAIAEVRRRFDLTKVPLLRSTLIVLAPDDHVLLLTFPHIAFDGWSWGVFARELRLAYDAYAAPDGPSLPALPVQYADYAVFERTRLAGERLESHLAYWKQVFATPPTILQLRSDKRPGEDSAFRGAFRGFEFPVELGLRLKALCQREGVTMYMALLAGYATLLLRYTGQEDIVVGSPVANRGRPELEGLIGCFMNPLPVRLDLSGNPTFRELLSRVRRSTLDALAHQDVAFDLLVRTLYHQRDAGLLPLFQVMFIFQNLYMQPPAMRGLEVELADASGGDVADIGQLAYPVCLEMEEAGGRIAGRLEYLVDYQTVLAQLPGHLQTLLEGVTANPDQQVRAIPILTAAERQQILEEWRGERKDYPTGVLVHELLEAQAARTPQATAIVSGEARLTYAELNARANRLACHLQSLGVGKGSLVGILLERSIDMVIALFGVLKAGGAYVPLDAGYPAERLALIIEETEMRALITRDKLAAGLSRPQSQIITLDRIAELLHSLSDANRARTAAPGGLTPDDLAYVIYTSGSTGRPKGTMITHESLVNAYFAWEDAYRLRSDVRSHLGMASFSFDVCTGDIVRALGSGGKLVLAPQEMLGAPDRLYALMRAEEIDCAEFVPVVFRELMRYLDESGQTLDFMRLLIVGSDRWYVSEFERARTYGGPATRLINSYGITEVTIDSTYFDQDASNLARDKLVPIGQAFPNTELYVLDSRLEPVPAGVVGELYLGGPGLARGYLKRPDLTEERFIPHPFSAKAGARLYRSGDMARFLADGQIEFLGRDDHQVKLRGFRIELGEIEGVLAKHPAVREGVVLLREDRPGDARLVAYVVLNEGLEASPSELRRLLRSRLPEYMVPSAVVQLDALPITPNGKVDRKKLPPPQSERQADDPYVAPATQLEQRIAGIWCEVLRVEKVGANDNFFDLGGHSFLLMQVHNRMRETLSCELSLVEMFEHPTVSSLAAHLNGKQPRADRLDPARERANKQAQALAARQRQRRAAHQTE
ncbi:MAG: amino acid adenylation domain-containing protein [Planctomycetota bacterium]